MASKRGRSVDAEVDLHGLNADEMRRTLEGYWPSWRGLRSVRVIHGRGEILLPAVQTWCRDRAIAFETEPNNAGATLLYPSQRTLPTARVSVTLAEKGLRLTPEQEALLRDPQALERARREAARLREAELARRKSDAAKQEEKARRDASLWQAEMRRLDGMEKKRTGSAGHGGKPIPPRIIPPAEIKHQEGYWRSELVRVADTDTETLKKEKRTGLDKLAPPMPERPLPRAAEEARPAARPTRDTAADQALFEQEMQRLSGADPDSGP